MAEKDSIIDEIDSTDSSENQSSEGWTIIGGKLCKNDDTDDDMISVDDVAGGHDALRGLEILELDKNTLNLKSNSNDVEKHIEDSDGISVITESETEHLIVEKDLSETHDCKNKICQRVKKYVRREEKTMPQFGMMSNIVIACSLAAIIGLGAGRILDMYDECPITNVLDFSGIKLESETLIQQLKELSEVKGVLDEIKSSIPEIKESREYDARRMSKSKSKRWRRAQKFSEIPKHYARDADTNMLEQLQTSLNTLCSVINGVNSNNSAADSDMLKAQRIVSDLIEFKNTLNELIVELENVDRPKEMEFLTHAERKISDISKLLLDDLTFTIHGLTMKIHHKLNKVRHKLNKRLCMLQNTEPHQLKSFESFTENNSFLASCDRILNISSKSNIESAKMKKQEKNYKKLKTLRMSSTSEQDPANNFPSQSKPDHSNSSTISCSSSSNCVHIVDKDFWNNKRIVELQASETETNNTNKTMNGRKSSKVETNTSQQLNNAQCYRNLIKDEVFFMETCPIVQEAIPKSESIHQEIEHAEKPGISDTYSKPLYSTVVKAVRNTIITEKDYAINTRSPDAKMLDAGQITRVEDQTVDSNTEWKHLTSVRSEDNVQSAHDLKVESKSNIQSPAMKFDGVPNPNNISTRNVRTTDKKSYEEAKFPIFSNCREGQKCRNLKSTGVNKTYKNKLKNSKSHHKKNQNNVQNNDDIKKSRTRTIKKGEKLKLEKKFTPTKIEKKKEIINNHPARNHLMTGEWQLQRSRARELHRYGDRRSEWLFDRANSRRNAKDHTYTECNTPLCQSREYRSSYEDDNMDKDFDDYWLDTKDMNSRKYANSRAGFTAKKIKLSHQKNMRQSRHR